MAHDFKRFPELTNNQMQFYYFDSPHRQITESFTAEVVKVTDGDSIRVLWNERDFDFPVRLSKINAPELNTGARGEASRDFLEDLLMGEEVFIIVDPKNRVGKFGRILGEIIVKGMSANAMSLNSGHSGVF